MPELPDILAYLQALTPRVVGQPIERARALSPFVVRTVDPQFSEIEGKQVRTLDRLGKRIVFVLDDELYLIVHLMIAGRLRWRPRDGKLFGRITLA
ncbi:MAG TPA: DNA-formamidopyrimidine glycosylase family protein, partial [Gemmatimonadaceae bacterium]|nr:DNA-formamidopyrimidine glycosylase family protein [Gemmatimonadaceae bacterium]